MGLKTWAALVVFVSLLLPIGAQLPNPEYYTLYYTTSNNTQLIDSNGSTLHTWPNNLTALSGTTAYLREDGLLLRSGQRGPNLGGFLAGSYSSLQLITWEGEVVWQFDLQAQGSVTLHHDMKCLPNGNILATVWDFVPAAEMRTLGWNPTAASGLWLERIIEIEPNLTDGSSEIVWSWELRDHLVQDFDADLSTFGTVSASPGKVDINFFNSNTSTDPFHISGIEFNPERDEIILCPNVTDELWIIDHSTTTAEAASSSGGTRGRGGDLIYRWGNPAVYGSAGPNAQKRLERAHDVRLLECSSENCVLTVHNNDRVDDDPGDIDSQVLRIELPLDEAGNYLLEPGQAFGPTEPEVLYEIDPANPFFSTPFMGGAQVLANGHILLTLPLTPRLVEVDLEGEIVWDLTIPGGGFAFKAQNYPINYSGYGPSLPFNYEVWRAANFGVAATDTPPSEDPDDDERSNLLEYYLGSNPLAENGIFPLSATFEQEASEILLSAQHSRRRNLTDAEGRLEFSRTLSPWLNEIDSLTLTEETTSQSDSQEKVTFEATLDTELRGFFRLAVELIE